MGVRIYDPTGSTRRTSWTPPARRDEEERREVVTRPTSFREYGMRVADGTYKPAKPQAPKDDGDKGLAERFFGTGFGKGLGAVLNHPIAKSITQPLDILGVPQRAIASTIQEGVDFVQGEGFSGKDWYNQINPLFFAHGENAQDSIGMGDVLHDVGGTGNQYLDAALGFGLDVATDPLTYVFGLGVVDKGLDAARAGTRLGAAIEKAGSKVDDIADFAKTAEWQARNAGKGTRASLTGRPVRMDRVSQAQRLIERADPQALDKLYGGENLASEALKEIQYRAGRGLGAKSPNLSPAANELVETALNIKPPATRMRVPLSGRQGVAIPGSEGLAQGVANRLGNRRLAFNTSRTGSALVDAKSPIDYERAIKVLAKGENADPTAFAKAAGVVRTVEGSRAPAGRFLNLGQRTVRQQRRQLQDEIRKAGGRAEYVKLAETTGGTTLNRLFDHVVELAKNEFGITIPKLSEGGLNYIPHVYAPEFRRVLTSNRTFAEDWLRRFGGSTEQDLLAESGRFKSRQILPDMDIELPNGQVFNTGDGAVDTINARAKAAGFKGRVLEDEPIKLIDDYIQIVSEDVGRRAARADQIALGSADMRYVSDLETTPALIEEAVTEQRAAAQRLGIAFDEAQVRESIMSGYVPSRNALRADMPKQLTDGQITRIGRVLGDEGNLLTLVENELDRWVRIGDNGLVMMDPAVDAMMKNVLREIKDANVVARIYNALNRYFKNFAVLTPGFHIRNGMSAIFMNFADGVPAKVTLEGIDLWRQFSRAAKHGDDFNAGLTWLAKQPDEVRAAFDAVFGSGAGGRFTEAGIGESMGSKIQNALLENRLTRASQDAGAFVEGSVRMGMALDTIRNGGSISDATSRITRVHFDYSQVSRLDESMKRLMPFYSFLSRNIPLQMMQQWSRPGTYARYEAFRRNFAQPGEFEEGGEEVPDYIKEGKGIPFNLGPFGNWLEPDFPHTRVQEDVARLGNVFEDPLGATSNLSPVITAPLEYAFAQDAFTGQRFGADDWEALPFTPANIIPLLASVPAGILTDNVQIVDGQVLMKSELLNAIQAIDPNTARLGRVTGQGGAEPARQWEAILRTLGAPVRNITPKQIRNAELSRRFDEEDLRARERGLKEAARGG